MQLSASAPGSLMLLGEYAVLYGAPCLVCAIDKRVTVTLTSRNDSIIQLMSDRYESYTTNCQEIYQPSFTVWQIVLSVLKRYAAYLSIGCQIMVQSNYSEQWGLGSSAALTVAVLMVVTRWLGQMISPLQLLLEARAIQQTVQGGIGSGADIAASIYGGLVIYCSTPLRIKKQAIIYPLSVIYSGFKTKTAVAVRKVQETFIKNIALFHYICESIGQCACAGVKIISNSSRASDCWQQLGLIMNHQHRLLQGLGVSLPLLNTMQTILQQRPEIFGAKISGSGLGDCVIGLGEISSDTLRVLRTTLNSTYPTKAYSSAVQLLPVAMSIEGARYE